jgi:hypothetical protein
VLPGQDGLGQQAAEVVTVVGRRGALVRERGQQRLHGLHAPVVEVACVQVAHARDGGAGARVLQARAVGPLRPVAPLIATRERLEVGGQPLAVVSRPSNDGRGLAGGGLSGGHRRVYGARERRGPALVTITPLASPRPSSERGQERLQQRPETLEHVAHLLVVQAELHQQVGPALGDLDLLEQDAQAQHGQRHVALRLAERLAQLAREHLHGALGAGREEAAQADAVARVQRGARAEAALLELLLHVALAEAAADFLGQQHHHAHVALAQVGTPRRFREPSERGAGRGEQTVQAVEGAENGLGGPQDHGVRRDHAARVRVAAQRVLAVREVTIGRLHQLDVAGLERAAEQDDALLLGGVGAHHDVVRAVQQLEHVGELGPVALTQRGHDRVADQRVVGRLAQPVHVHVRHDGRVGVQQVDQGDGAGLGLATPSAAAARGDRGDQEGEREQRERSKAR